MTVSVCPSVVAFDQISETSFIALSLDITDVVSNLYVLADLSMLFAELFVVTHITSLCGVRRDST